MIGAPINDAACLDQLTAIAREGATRADVKALAARFRDTAELARWIRSLPQRDDTGEVTDGPRVVCDVGQRARLLAEDPNCFERTLTFLAVAEVIDPLALRQLATVDISEHARHTFPVENGEPVVLDPRIPRNALRALVWKTRNGEDANGIDPDASPIDAAQLLSWLIDLAADVAAEAEDDRAVRRVERARHAMRRLLDGGEIHPRDRAEVLYAFRLAGDVAPMYGRTGREGYRLARQLIARALTYRTRGAPVRNLSVERAVYWGGKTVATYYGVGGLYDSAYNEVRHRVSAPPAAPPAVPASTPPPSTPAVSARVTATVATSAPDPGRRTEQAARPAMVLGALVEIEPWKGT
jgi:hypothetical protein